MTTINPDLDNSAVVQTVSKKDKKPYNGYLRNTNRKQQSKPNKPKSEMGEKKFFKPKPQDVYEKQIKRTANKPKKAYYNNHNNTNMELPYEDSDVNQSGEKINHFSRERQLLSYIRQRSGFNPQYFLKELDDILLSQSFSDLSSDNSSIISQLVLHSKEEVFPLVLNKYGHYLTKEEFENIIFPYALNKNVVFLQESLPFYIKQYKSSHEFLENLIIKACKTSYRSENNAVLLTFFNKKCLKKQQELFWNSCIENKNIVLFEAALKYKKLHAFLIKNFDKYEDMIISLGKIHTVKKSIGQPEYIDLSDDKEEEESIINDIQVKTFLGNHEEQFQSLQKKEVNKPEIVIRKKRKIV